MSTTDLVPFIFDGREVRIIDRDGQPWFVVADVCAVLDLGDTTVAVREQEPWLAQLTTDLIYRRLTIGVLETLQTINPVPSGRRWRARKHHQHVSTGEAERQFARLLGECVGALSAAQTWEDFLKLWDVMHPLVSLLPIGIEATLADTQLWLFNPFVPVSSFKNSADIS